jgi:2-hydroxychromene-2-carboxylate isomerase
MTNPDPALHREMTHRAFAVTWDYRCPFARNAHEHVIDALAAGVDWDVTFVPFSLGQVHVQEGQPDVWDDPSSDSGLLALQAGVVVRDKFADRFLPAHRALFALRHDEGGHLRDPDAVRATLERADVDADAVFEEIASGRPLQTVREEHTAYAGAHGVWGVPTFVDGDQAVFVRLMNRPHGDAGLATATIERVIDLLAWPELNEFKHTSIPR